MQCFMGTQKNRLKETLVYVRLGPSKIRGEY